MPASTAHRGTAAQDGTVAIFIRFFPLLCPRNKNVDEERLSFADAPNLLYLVAFLRCNRSLLRRIIALTVV
jgi:hypothetical protein